MCVCRDARGGSAKIKLKLTATLIVWKSAADACKHSMVHPPAHGPVLKEITVTSLP